MALLLLSALRLLLHEHEEYAEVGGPLEWVWKRIFDCVLGADEDELRSEFYLKRREKVEITKLPKFCKTAFPILGKFFTFLTITF